MSERAPNRFVGHRLVSAYSPQHARSRLSHRPSDSGGPGASTYESFLCPAGAGERINDAIHGLRWLEDSLASPVATTARPFGAEHNPSGALGGGAGSAADAPVRGLFVPEGRWGVATGGASRSDAEPVDRTRAGGFCPGGAEGMNDGLMRDDSSAPAGAGFTHRPASTGCVGEAPTSPVATSLDPSGVKGRRHARAADAPVRARDSGAAGRGAGDGLKRPPRPAVPHARVMYQHGHCDASECYGGRHV
jgi:hypothetical protein